MPEFMAYLSLKVHLITTHTHTHTHTYTHTHTQFSILYGLSFVLIILGVFIYNLKQPSVAKKKEVKEDSRKKSKSKEKVSQGSTTSHRHLEERLQELLESQSTELSCTGTHGNMPPLKRPHSHSNKSYGSVEMDCDNKSPKTKRHKGLLREE